MSTNKGFILDSDEEGLVFMHVSDDFHTLIRKGYDSNMIFRIFVAMANIELEHRNQEINGYFYEISDIEISDSVIIAKFKLREKNIVPFTFKLNKKRLKSYLKR